MDMYITLHIFVFVNTIYIYTSKFSCIWIVTRKYSDSKDTSYETYMRDGDCKWSRLPHFTIDKDI